MILRLFVNFNQLLSQFWRVVWSFLRNWHGLPNERKLFHTVKFNFKGMIQAIKLYERNHLQPILPDVTMSCEAGTGCRLLKSRASTCFCSNEFIILPITVLLCFLFSFFPNNTILTENSFQVQGGMWWYWAHGYRLSISVWQDKKRLMSIKVAQSWFN